ncbi:MAG: hypothetical protein AB7Q45_11475 [Planctomycetaceae bacterium]
MANVRSKSRQEPATLQAVQVPLPNGRGGSTDQQAQGLIEQGTIYLAYREMKRLFKFSSADLTSWKTTCVWLDRPIDCIERDLLLPVRSRWSQESVLRCHRDCCLYSAQDASFIVQLWADSKRKRVAFSDDGDWPTVSEATRTYGVPRNTLAYWIGTIQTRPGARWAANKDRPGGRVKPAQELKPSDIERKNAKRSGQSKRTRPPAPAQDDPRYAERLTALECSNEFDVSKSQAFRIFEKLQKKARYETDESKRALIQLPSRHRPGRTVQFALRSALVPLLPAPADDDLKSIPDAATAVGLRTRKKVDRLIEEGKLPVLKDQPSEHCNGLTCDKVRVSDLKAVLAGKPPATMPAAARITGPPVEAQQPPQGVNGAVHPQGKRKRGWNTDPEIDALRELIETNRQNLPGEIADIFNATYAENITFRRWKSVDGRKVRQVKADMKRRPPERAGK